MSQEFRFVDFEELDFLELGGDIFAGFTGPIGPTGVAGATGSTGSTGTDSLLISYNTNGVAVNNQFILSSGQTASESVAQYLAGKTGQFVALYLYHQSNPAQPWTYTLRINGVDTALTLTTNAAGFSAATANVPFVASDIFAVHMTSAGAGVVTRITLEYVV